jgi:hypothetical protein
MLDLMSAEPFSSSDSQYCLPGRSPRSVIRNSGRIIPIVFLDRFFRAYPAIHAGGLSETSQGTRQTFMSR